MIDRGGLAGHLPATILVTPAAWLDIEVGEAASSTGYADLADQ